jgi:hypothetical protein
MMLEYHVGRDDVDTIANRDDIDGIMFDFDVCYCVGCHQCYGRASGE